MASAPFTNHLAGEKSPYLQQHVHNPVDWYPWGHQAFELAKKENKPIFLSIGYATCHWCHVMEKESFENPEIATPLNEAFVCIKVDREELPDVDALYMDFAQALMSSSGGWPLNVVLTPDLKPLVAATYLPPRARRGLIGLDEFIKQIQGIWNSEHRSEIVEQADQIVEIFQKASVATGEDVPPAGLVPVALKLIFDACDPVFGGFKGAPKFPMSYQAEFLLQFSRLKSDGRALFLAETTLEMMQRGGIYDHLGGGFSRYSVDEKWRIPHFEKMSSDNALLASAYIEAWRYTNKEEFKICAAEILDYLLREMQHPEGGFYTAEDADTDGIEGLYYTWAPDEVRGVLSLEEGELFCQFYGVTAEGNFEGRNVLHMALSQEDFSKKHNVSIEALKQILTHAKQLVFKKRQERPRPFKDDKILTAINGLMIHAFSLAAAAFNEERYLQAAVKAAEFLESHLWKDNKLMRRWREGEARFSGKLEDYAFLIRGLLTLFETQGDSRWLKWAVQLATVLEMHFKADNGAFYQSDAQDLLIRKCDFYDGAEPSGNGVHCENLLRLFQMTQNEKYLTQAEEILMAAKPLMEAHPQAAMYHLIALQRYYDAKAPTLFVALNNERSSEKEIASALQKFFHPHAAVVWKKNEDLGMILSSVKDKTPIEGQTAVYICRQDQCLPPLIKKEEIIKAIQEL